MRVLLCALMMSGALAAGCLDASDDDGPVAPTAAGLGASPDDVVALALDLLVQSHDHADAALHAGLIGADVVSSVAPVPYRSGVSEGFFELVVKGDRAFFTTTAASGNVDPEGQGGFVAFDVSDPAAPQELARWVGQPLGDLEVSDDGRFAFAATQRNGYPFTWAFGVPPDGAAPRGVSIVDLGDDATSAETVGYAPLPTNGPHTITYVQTPDGRELLLACTYDLIFTLYPESIGQNKATQKLVVFEFERGPTPTLTPLSVFQILDPDEGEEEYFPHDVTVHIDPATGATIASIAYWDMGLVLVDISDPTAPRELSRFRDTAPSEYVSTHLVRVFPGTIDGRVVAVLEPEIPTGEDTGTFTFVDITDPTAPTKLGTWMLPGELVIDEPFRFSPHNFDLSCGGEGQATGRPVDYGAPCVDPYVVLSHNHAGLWFLDARDPTDPRPVGYYYPEAQDDGAAPSGFGTAFVRDGLAWAVEYNTGLHVLRLHGTDAAVAAG